MPDFITLSSLKSYAVGCQKVQEQAELLVQDGFKFMVIPSRGAGPIAETASTYFFTVRRNQEKDPSKRLSLTRDYMLSGLCNPLYLPFTADIPKDFTGFDSAIIRRFWARVLRSLLYQDDADISRRFYEFIRSDVCSISTGGSLNRTVEQQKFTFLDTVVSGRAIVEISQAFEECGLANVHYILVIDQNGERLRPENYAAIKNWESDGKATLIYVEKLFTEDEGPFASGIWCVTMPQLMEVAMELIPEFSAAAAVGAGIYYHEVKARDDGSNLAFTVAASQLHVLLFSMYLPHKSPNYSQNSLDEYLDHVEYHKLRRPETTVGIASPRLSKSVRLHHRVEPSSSHALRLHMDKDDAARLVRKFLRM